MDDIFTAEQLAELRKPLDRRLISERKGEHGKVKYLQGRVVIDQAQGCNVYMKKQEKRFSVRFPLDVLEAIRELAKEENRSLNGEIVQAVLEYIAQRKRHKSNA
jgi:hypothetical protein